MSDTIGNTGPNSRHDAPEQAPQSELRELHDLATHIADALAAMQAAGDSDNDPRVAQLNELNIRTFSLQHFVAQPGADECIRFSRTRIEPRVHHVGHILSDNTQLVITLLEEGDTFTLFEDERHELQLNRETIITAVPDVNVLRNGVNAREVLEHQGAVCGELSYFRQTEAAGDLRFLLTQVASVYGIPVRTPEPIAARQPRLLDGELVE